MHWIQKWRCRRRLGHLLEFSCTKEWAKQRINMAINRGNISIARSTYWIWSHRCTTPSSSAIRIARRFSMAIVPIQGPKFPATTVTRWMQSLCMLGRRAARRARGTHEWHSIPGNAWDDVVWNTCDHRQGCGHRESLTLLNMLWHPLNFRGNW